MRRRNRKRFSMNRYRTGKEGIVRIPGGTGKEEGTGRRPGGTSYRTRRDREDLKKRKKGVDKIHH